MKFWLTILLLSTASISVVIALVILSEYKKYQRGNFRRHIQTEFLRDSEIFDLGYNSYYFAGTSNTHIYLGNYSSPYHLLVFNKITRDTQHLRLLFPPSVPVHPQEVHIFVDSPFVYAIDGNAPFVIKGRLSSKKFSEAFQEVPRFSSHFGVPISPNDFIIRTYDRREKKNILAKISLTSDAINFAREPLQKMADGILCTDGILQGARENRLVYAYFYRSEFVCMDTSLRVIYRKSMLDSTRYNVFNIAEIESEDTRTFSSPPPLTNRKGSSFGEYMFINSVIPAMNDDVKLFDQHPVIDVYKISNGGYEFSFYITGGRKYFGHMLLSDQSLFILDERFLFNYSLNWSVISKAPL